MNNENKETIKKRITTGEEFEELEFDFTLENIKTVFEALNPSALAYSISN